MAIKDSDILITPPQTTRTRESSADQEILAAMAKNVKEGQYVTDGTVYKTYSDAGNGSQVYRRALAKAINVEPHKIVSKTWGMKGDVLLTDRDKPGDWRFALSLDNSRQKRERKPAEAAA